MVKTFLYILLFLVSMGTYAQGTNADIARWAQSYRCSAEIAPCKLESYIVDDARRTVTVTFGGGFQEQVFTPEVVERVYREVSALLPSDKSRYTLSIVTDGLDIRDLVPDMMRKSDHDKTRVQKKEYTGKPWTANLSAPYLTSFGLDNTHIALWQSHGRYWKASTNQWSWQRPRIFCTCEDLLSQTFVVPYIIPMLENAGAVVYTPRERDYQTNEVIVNNDQPTANGTYIEASVKSKPKHAWQNMASAGFNQTKLTYTVTESPFVSGTVRYIPTVSSEKDESYARWMPNIPAKGRYAVYVTYQSVKSSTDEALYTIVHNGGETNISVNQRIGGGTWVYLGTYEFNEGISDKGAVILTNYSKSKGIVTADAVRFGGGIGNISPSETIPTSGMPRWMEAAKYSAQWNGMPYQVHSSGYDGDEYKNDINVRSAATNRLSGGSLFNPNCEGLGVPIELTVAFHTDAGFKPDDSYIGSLSIYKTDVGDGKTGSGLSRYVDRDLSSMLLHNLQQDLSKYNWTIRQLWNRNYSEAREPMSTSCILEMLSHQNFSDMRLAYNPQFRFDFSRSVYKTITKFVAHQHHRQYVIQPLPPTDFRIQLNDKKRIAALEWTPVNDPTEPSATPTEYIVYTRVGDADFDNGVIVRGTSHNVKLEPGVVYSFRVCAANKGGRSFPTETLAAYCAPKNKGNILIVNAFTRLEGPAEINTSTMQGFDLDADPGVPYGLYTGYCGRQISFDRSKAGSEKSDGLGYSGNELECQPFMGNTFDYPYLHGKAYAQMANYSFTSCSETAFNKDMMPITDYRMIDVICGTQKQFSPALFTRLQAFQSIGGAVLLSGSNLDRAPQRPFLHISHSTPIRDRSSQIGGCGLTFGIYRDINAVTYAVPTLSLLNPSIGAFNMLAYSNGYSAGVAFQGSRTGGGSTITLGFPIESITEQSATNQLMAAFVNFLMK